MTPQRKGLIGMFVGMVIFFTGLIVSQNTSFTSAGYICPVGILLGVIFLIWSLKNIKGTIK